MAFAIASDARVAYIAEATDGTTPTTPAFQTARVTGESLEVQRKLVYGNELNGFRGAVNHALAGKSGAGGFDFEFSNATLEDLLESVLRNTWSTDALTNANTPKPFTFETKFETGATDIYKRLKGAQVDALSLECRAQEIVTGRLGVLARIADFANAAESGATYTAAGTDPILVGNDVGSISASGLTFDAVHTITLSINNNMRARNALGQLEAVELAPDQLKITGVLGLYLSASEFDVLTAFQAATATSLTFRLGATAGSITEIVLPKIVLEEPKPAAESADGDVLLNLNFRALQDSSSSNELIEITRNI